MSFDVEKSETGLAIAHRKIESLIGRKLLDDELTEGAG